VRLKRKKKRDRGSRRSSFLEERRIEQIRQVKMGKQRRVLEYDASLETQLRQTEGSLDPGQVA
jgi:hypothetical protein